ncbi:D-tyrosyl-tRNA(Tyr) deacylase [Candidatus Woesebacteria bacterium RIFCSPHIGHO2_01_FULL_44_21]|uniref:D-aminoacyl-tRNA deacylase n=1 Tax=Candidatus Woesebacteria bacterium RIFCSPHIGHO2_01_FULL_44_21 TaxID=1802503 RepID=A0A1F7YWB0_9BACT|nr:MAG: D-tyrosyl-tRNA(Tyr) deacylase [Candidatus Woesebacteria bacterium RIFCSPHIGHO2_01_FULL_44_21]OGM70444.1 MAG: D-tyrosyl-tRNA(Tyr) deacylase [Candidatus Woesebacteria bacterium RIFCSPLOWO2_01_FULL_44_24b]
MRLVIQRVNSAEVSVSDKTVGKIGKGLFVLIGIKKGDSQKDADILADKLVKLRVMADSSSKMNLSVKDANAQILSVSQFTLYANTKDGNRPSFIEAEEPEKAKELYEYFVSKLKNSGLVIETGEFGEYMKINCELDGPVTVILES